MKKAVMNFAWNLYKSLGLKSFALALKLAWKKIKLSTKLKEGIVNFEYMKKDGSLRKAVGTLNETLFTYESKCEEKRENLSLVKYFDLEANAFRSFLLINLL